MNNTKLSRPSIDGNEFIAIDGHMYRITAISDLDIHLISINDQRPKVSTLMDLFSQPNVILGATLTELRYLVTDNYVAPHLTPDAAIDPQLLERAEQYLATVARIDAIVAEKKRLWEISNKKTFRKTPALEAACAEFSRESDETVGLNCYYKYARRCKQFNMDRIAIAASFKRSDAGHSRLSTTQQHFLDTCAMRLYADRKTRLQPEMIYQIMMALLKKLDYWWLNPEKCDGPMRHDLVETLFTCRIPIETIRSNPEAAALLEEISLPSRTTFRKYLKWYVQNPNDGKEAIIERFGPEEWERNHKIFDHYVKMASRPLQYVFADHLLLKIYLRSESGEIVQLWLTVLIDAWSRCVIGFALLPDGPSTKSIQTALQHAIWPKNQEKLLDLDINLVWNCYGIPNTLSLDNAWAHHSSSLRNLAGGISHQNKYASIKLDFRPPYMARYGAIIERLFGNFAGRVREFLPGAIHRKTPDGIRHAKQNASMYVSDMHRVITKLIVMYHHDIHSELDGLTPYQRWMNGIDEFGLPSVPPRTIETELLFWIEYHETRTITDKGIRLFGLHYILDDQSKVGRVRPDGKKVEYAIRYNPDDISRIAIFRRIIDGDRTLDNSFISMAYAKEFRLPDGRIQPLSLVERKIFQETIKQNNNNHSHWLDFFREIQELNTRSDRPARHRQSSQAQVSSTTVNNNVTDKKMSDPSLRSINLLKKFSGETDSDGN
jgi:transposase InsO family protein